MSEKLPDELTGLLNLLGGHNRPPPAEGLLLLKAFMGIRDPSLRATIVALVEKIAAAQQKR